jgi:hypothetical protein
LFACGKLNRRKDGLFGFNRIQQDVNGFRGKFDAWFSSIVTSTVYPPIEFVGPESGHGAHQRLMDPPLVRVDFQTLIEFSFDR